MKPLFTTLLLCLFLASWGQTQGDGGEAHYLKITDQQSTPVIGVYLVHRPNHRLLTTSDVDGECVLFPSSFSPGDSILFQGIGYISRTISWNDLRQMTEITLQPLAFELGESVVYAITTKELLEKAMGKLKKLPRHTLPYCNFEGKAQYEKITEYFNRTLEYRREYGYYFTSGDVTPRDHFDQRFRSYFVPIFSARSLNLSNNGRDTLSSLYMTTEEQRYDAGTRKVFTLLRAIQLNGPLFSGTKAYNISPVESNSPDYVFSFQTRSEAYPTNTQITCRGTFEIDIEQHVLKKISFDYVDYQLYRQILLSGKRKIGSPFSTRAEILISYDEQDQPYIRSCTMETYWKNNPGEQYLLVEQPSRLLPAMGNLIEKEAFYCYDYREMEERLRNRNTLSRIHLMQRNPVGAYDPSLFARLPILLENQKAVSELSKFMDLEDQYELNDNRSYYPYNYLIGFNGAGRYDPLYEENNQKERAKFFENFPPPSYP